MVHGPSYAERRISERVMIYLDQFEPDERTVPTEVPYDEQLQIQKSWELTKYPKSVLLAKSFPANIGDTHTLSWYCHFCSPTAVEEKEHHVSVRQAALLG